MYKYQIEQCVLTDHPNLLAVKAQIINRMKQGDDGIWYKLKDKSTGHALTWTWHNEITGSNHEIDWFPEKDLVPITHSLGKNNPNKTFKADMGRLMQEGS